MTIERAVYAALNGGLGNQMFQYACAFARARELGVPLKLRWDGVDRHIVREPELGFFDDRLPEVSAAESRYWRLRWLLQVPLTRLLPAIRPWLRKRVHAYLQDRPEFVFHPEVEALRAPCFLEGTWQNPRYFRDHRDGLRRFFARYDRLGPSAAALGHELRATPSVSVHVRLGDYVWGPHAEILGGVCTAAYYRKAIDQIAGQQPDARFFLFSDDLEGARALLSDDPRVVVPSEARFSSHEDLLLMSLCRHHVISNSTFAWWGAWLGDHPNKIVVAPRAWLTQRGLGEFDTHEICPASWVRLDGGGR